MTPDDEPSAPPTPLLDADIVQALLEAQADAAPVTAPDARRNARLRRGLLARIAEDQTASHHTVPPGEPEGWHTMLPGIERKVLHEEGQSMSYLLRFAPGAVLPSHRHPQDEECLVLEGVLRIGTELVLPAGSYHLARGGRIHAAITADQGAVIFLRGAAPAVEQLV